MKSNILKRLQFQYLNRHTYERVPDSERNQVQKPKASLIITATNTSRSKNLQQYDNRIIDIPGGKSHSYDPSIQQLDSSSSSIDEIQSMIVRRQSRWYSDRWKAFFAYLILMCCLFINSLSLVFTHNRVPDRNIYKPLPDVLLDNINENELALRICEILLIVNVLITTVCILIHKLRLVIARRVFLMMSLLYLYRAVTMYITVTPVPSNAYICSPPLDLTVWGAIRQASLIIFGMGLSINGYHILCGDNIYSGHTLVFIFCYLLVAEYSSDKFKIRWVVLVTTVSGIIMLLVSHSHYSIDVLIAYFITTRLFWTYHTLVKQKATGLLEYNYFTREWWTFAIFRYFER